MYGTASPQIAPPATPMPMPPRRMRKSIGIRQKAARLATSRPVEMPSSKPVNSSTAACNQSLETGLFPQLSSVSVTD